jgi:hypothetical protein
MLRREEREGGANIVIRAIRYMWSDIDSPLLECQYMLGKRVGEEVIILCDTKSTPAFTLGCL